MNIIKVVKLLGSSNKEDHKIAIELLLQDSDLLIKVAGIAFLTGITSSRSDTSLVKEKLGDTYEIYHKLNLALKEEIKPEILLESILKTLL